MHVYHECYIIICHISWLSFPSWNSLTYSTLWDSSRVKHQHCSYHNQWVLVWGTLWLTVVNTLVEERHVLTQVFRLKVHQRWKKYSDLWKYLSAFKWLAFKTILQSKYILSALKIWDVKVLILQKNGSCQCFTIIHVISIISAFYCCFR